MAKGLSKKEAAMVESSTPPAPERIAEIRAVFTNEVIRAIGALARQQNVCREQGGSVVFVTGMDAAREYITEQLAALLAASKET